MEDPEVPLETARPTESILLAVDSIALKAGSSTALQTANINDNNELCVIGINLGVDSYRVESVNEFFPLRVDSLHEYEWTAIDIIQELVRSKARTIELQSVHFYHHSCYRLPKSISNDQLNS